MPGIFISRFVTLTLSDITISFGPNGTSGSSKALVSYDVCPIWLEIAIEHLKAASGANSEMITAWADPTAANDTKGETLERVFRHSMQAMTAAAIAIDGFYAAIQKKIRINPALIDKWRANKTARYSQVAETVRIAYQLKPKGSKAFRDTIREIYKFRDQAVHPSAAMEEAILHSDIDVGVERRFVVFRYDNAFQIVRIAVTMIDELARNGNVKNDAIKKYPDALGTATEILRNEPLLGLRISPQMRLRKKCRSSA
jgi:hypothetical protein